MTQRDLDFISAKYADYEIPKEKRFLLKYFTSDLQVAFLKYYLCFGDWKLFSQHTGFYCTHRILYRFVDRYEKLIKAHDEAKSTLSEECMEQLLIIEQGNFKYQD